MIFTSCLISSRLLNCSCTCPTSWWRVTRVGLSPALLQKPLSCAQQGDKDAHWVQPQFWLHSWERHGTDRLWWKSSGLICAPPWTKVLPCNTTLWPHQKTEHCSRQGALGVESLLWFRQKNLPRTRCPKGVFGHSSSSEIRQFPPSLGPTDKQEQLHNVMEMQTCACQKVVLLLLQSRVAQGQAAVVHWGLNWMLHVAGGHRTLHTALSQPTPTIYRARSLAKKVNCMLCNHSVDKCVSF